MQFKKTKKVKNQTGILKKSCVGLDGLDKKNYTQI